MALDHTLQKIRRLDDEMDDVWPKILSREILILSPWMNVITREVQLTPDSRSEIYHAVGQPDYLAVVALDPDGFIPIVRQYRPALERFTWELPAGLLDKGEEPGEACARELLEETGYRASSIHSLGRTCTGRISNSLHSYFIKTAPRDVDFKEEQGVAVRLVDPPELVNLIRTGEFCEQLHLGTLLLAELSGLIKLPR